MTDHARYRKYNDHTLNSSTYHKKDGTPIRARLKQELEEEIKDHKCDFHYLTKACCICGKDSD
jgi:hypothetical protein